MGFFEWGVRAPPSRMMESCVAVWSPSGREEVPPLSSRKGGVLGVRSGFGAVMNELGSQTCLSSSFMAVPLQLPVCHPFEYSSPPRMRPVAVLTRCASSRGRGGELLLPTGGGPGSRAWLAPRITGRPSWGLECSGSGRDGASLRRPSVVLSPLCCRAGGYPNTSVTTLRPHGRGVGPARGSGRGVGGRAAVHHGRGVR